MKLCCQAQPQFQLSPVPAMLGWDSINFNFSPHTPQPPRESTVEDISSLWNHPWLLTSGPVPFDHATFVTATFVHATSVCATFFHTTFVQGQNLVVYKCNHSCLDQTIKFQTSYKAKPKLGQLQLMLSLAQLSPSLLSFLFVCLFLLPVFLSCHFLPTPYILGKILPRDRDSKYSKSRWSNIT